MENVWGWIIVLILIASGLIFFFVGGDKTYYPSDEERNNITIHLNKLGVTYYYSPTCVYCEKQKEFINFSKFNSKVNILKTQKKGINGVPAFFYKGELLYGMKNYEELKEIYDY